MTGFGPFNFQQPSQQQSQQFHQEASQRAMEMHQQAHQRAQQSAQSLQGLMEMQWQRQHQQWLNNLKVGYWAEQQRREQQEGQLGAWRKRPSLQVGQGASLMSARVQQQPGPARTGLQPTVLTPVKKERGGCARVVGGLFLFLFLGFCVSHAVMPLIM